MTPSTETVTLAGGCFWCLEAVYDQLRGVTSVVSGYAGGSVPNPSYEAVCSWCINARWRGLEMRTLAMVSNRTTKPQT